LEIIMRALHLVWIGGLSLLLGGCSSGGGLAPPPLNKDLLTGKWKSAVENQFISGYEFKGDGSFKVTFDGMEQPLTGKYTWSGDRSLDVEYPSEGEIRKAYAEAVKAYKTHFMERVKAGEIPDRAAGSLSVIREELPAKETLKVAIIEQPPVELSLTDELATSRRFQKAD
jgi:hypothetical protein